MVTIGLLALTNPLVPATSAFAQDANAPVPLTIGYVHLENDPRLNPRNVYYQIPVAQMGRAVVGAEVAILDAEFIGRELGVTFGLEIARNDNVDNLAVIAEGWVGDGIRFIVADLPAAELVRLADALAGFPVMIFNVSANEDALRGPDCRTNIIHAIPSERMLTDAVAQFLAENAWERVLVLRGPAAADSATVESLVASASLFGIEIIDIRDFASAPRDAAAANVALLTAGADYDVIFVADLTGEFASTVPYRSNDPRPVVGAAGLVPTAWHWAWERAGAPQLNARFEFLAERRAGAADWAAWISVRAIVQSVLRTGSTDYDDILAYLLSEEMTLDGAKGIPLSVRPWDHQLRQPILLATGNGVVERAPLDGFVDPVNNLDTLGVPHSQTECRF